MEKELVINVKIKTPNSAATKEYAEGTIGALEQAIRKLKNEMKNLEVGSAEHVSSLKNLISMQDELKVAMGRGIVPAMGNTTALSARATTTLQALNYTIRDSPYFFRDFSLGLLAVGNNLNPLIDGLISMKKAAQESGQTLGGVLLNSLKGTSGIILAFSFAVSAIQAVTFALAKNKSQADSTATSLNELKERVKQLKASFEDLADFEVQSTFRKLQEETIERFEKMRQTAISAASNSPYLNEDQIKAIERINKYYDNLINSLKVGLQESTFDQDVLRNIGILNKLVEAIQSKTPNAIQKIAQEYKLSADQIKNLGSQLGYLRDNIFVLGTETRKQDLPENVQRIAKEFHGTAKATDEAKKAIEAYGKAVKETSLKAKEEKPPINFTTDEELLAQIHYLENLYAISNSEKERNRILEKTKELTRELLGLEKLKEEKPKEYSLPNVADEELQNQIAFYENQMNITNSTREKFYLYQKILELEKELNTELENERQITEQIENTAREMAQKNTEKLLSTKDNEGYETTMFAVDQILERQQKIDHLANTLGNDIYQSFKHGKRGVDELLRSLGETIAKMLIIKGITALLGAIFPGASIVPAIINGVDSVGQGGVGMLGSIRTPATPPITTLAQTNVIQIKGVLEGSGSTLKAVIDTEDKIKKLNY